MNFKARDIFSQMQKYEQDIAHLEEKILDLETQMMRLLEIERNHLIRLKNGEKLPDDFILSGRPYLDLSPQKAWRLYLNPDFDFILIDISSKTYQEHKKLPEAIHIPWEDFSERFIEIQSKSIPLLIMCEDGTKSILACEFLAKRGLYNCNNISGGHKYWIGHRLEELKIKAG